MTDSHGHDEHGHEHPWYLKHHWDSPKQQFEAGKLGMWLFLATEVLLFGGLFCAYSVWRGNHPELFKYGSQFLDTTLGATNTAVLILSSLTMAWGVTAAQQNKQGLLKLMLFLTFLGAATFMVIKYFEYTHKFHEGWYPGLRFYAAPGEHSSYWGPHGEHGDVAPHAEDSGTHADDAAGHNTTTAPTTDDLEVTPATAAGHAGESASHAEGGGFELTTVSITMPEPAAAATAPSDLPPVEPSTVLPPAPAATGLAPHAEIVEKAYKVTGRPSAPPVHPLKDPVRPDNAHMFFNIYFMMTGLHGIHVLIGMIVIGWLFWGTMKGRFNSEYFTPVDLGGLYWHIVDLIWIFLFPLFYLI